MSAWTEKRRMIAHCDSIVDKGKPIEADPFEEDGYGEDVSQCTVTNSILLTDLKLIEFGKEGWTGPTASLHRWLTEILDPPWLVESTGYTTGLGATFRYTCPECLYEKEYPY